MMEMVAAALERCVHCVASFFGGSVGVRWSLVVSRWCSGWIRVPHPIHGTMRKVLLSVKPSMTSTWKHPRTGSTGPITGHTQ
jgi:hypothetical protein